MKALLPFHQQYREKRCVSGIEKYNYDPDTSFCGPKKSWFGTGTV